MKYEIKLNVHGFYQVWVSDGTYKCPLPWFNSYAAAKAYIEELTGVPFNDDDDDDD